MSLKQAALIREQNPDTTVTVVYKDMRTPASMELFYKNVQEDPGVMFTKGEVAGVEADGDDLFVTVTDTLIGGAIKNKNRDGSTRHRDGFFYLRRFCNRR